MSNICDTQYKARGSRKALSNLWNTLQMLGVNSKDVYLYKLAEHYGIDYKQSGVSVRGKIYSAFLSASCFHSRFAIACYGFKANVASCSKQTLKRIEI